MKQPDVPDEFQKKSIFEQYLFFHEYYVSKYGDQTLVLMQVGGFYEFYGIDNDAMKLGQVYEVAGLLHIEATRRNKEIRENSMHNWLMAGFPLVALGKFIGILMDHGFTVVQIDQVGTAKDKKKGQSKLPRLVSEVYSPGTYFIEDDVMSCGGSIGSSGEGNGGKNGASKYMVEIHIEGYDRMKREASIKSNYQPMIIGLSAIDVTTGQSLVYEVQNQISDHNYALDEVYRFLATYHPREVLVSSHNLLMDENSLMNYLDLRSAGGIRCQVMYNQVESDYYKLSYQRQFFSKIFKDSRNVNGSGLGNTILSVIEWLNLERVPMGIISYLMLLQYTYEHNEVLLRNLERPSVLTESGRMILANNAVIQLDLANGRRGRLGSVLGLLDWTSTGMGHRLFRDRLLNPITDPSELMNRYDKVEMFSETWIEIEKRLVGVMDLDRMHRRLDLGWISPNGLEQMYMSYGRIVELLEIVPEAFFFGNNGKKRWLLEFQEVMKDFDQRFDWAECSRYAMLEQIRDNFFKVGYLEKLDNLSAIIRENRRYIEIMTKRMSEVIIGGPGSIVVNVKHTDANGTFLSVTSKRFREFKEGLSKFKNKELIYKVGKEEFMINSDTFRVIGSNKDKTQLNITSDELMAISGTIEKSVEKLRKMVIEEYGKTLEVLAGKYRTFFGRLSSLVGEIDVVKSCARVAVRNGYVRPELDAGVGDAGDAGVGDLGAGVRLEGMRHPLIEKLHPEKPYVPQSFQLGTLSSSNDQSKIPMMNGMLLYGANSCGKSSCMKAVGINLVMAQAGLFVPCDRMIFRPYSQLLTRIIGNDNLFKGLSSFAVEMSELRGIMARADSMTLVLGDEICRGSETVSATAIVAASLMQLAESSSNYVFATHLHQLIDLPEVENLRQESGLGIYHLHVEYNPEDHSLVYYRDLRSGSGDPIYGIEVARAMDLDNSLLNIANGIRQRMMLGSDGDQVLKRRVSRYNASQYVDRCQICESVDASDVHHIKFQCTADNHGMIDKMHKNELRNLVSLCKSCHVAVHQGKFEIRGYIEGTGGMLLDYSVLQNSKTIETGGKKVRGKKNGLTFRKV